MAEKVNLLKLYNEWSVLDQNKNLVRIPEVGKYINGKENTASGQAVNFLSTEQSPILGASVVPGFVNRAQKGKTEYPIEQDSILDKVRVMDTTGTHNVDRNFPGALSYSSITPRE